MAESPEEFVRGLSSHNEVAKGVEVIQQWQAWKRLPSGFLADDKFELAKKIGITSFQSYVHWSEVEPEKGVYDFSYYDPLVRKIEQHGLKWVPFLIAGPYYSTPAWFRGSGESVFLKCLEHNKETVIQSIWNPNLPKHIDGFLKAFAEHYRGQDVFESIEVGISGNWGESIYPAGGGFDWKDSFHTHLGWWAGDKYARGDFVQSMKAKYETIDKLNAAWVSDYRSFDEVVPELLTLGAEFSRAQLIGNRIRWSDTVDWYVDSMTKWEEFWLATLRKYFPSERLYIVVGGDGNPSLGADFSVQVKVAAKYKAGIRITNADNDFANTFTVTQAVSTAARFYRTYYTTEPGGANDPNGVVMRVFHSTVGGSSGVYFKLLLDAVDNNGSSGDVTENAVSFIKNAKYLAVGQPRISAAIFVPTTEVRLSPKTLGIIYDRSKVLRDIVDHDYVDEVTIADGILDRYKFLVLLTQGTVRPETLKAIENWVAEGGVLIANERTYLRTFGNDKLLPKKGISALGKGYIAVQPERGQEYMDFIKDCLYGKDKPWKTLLPIDTEFDGVYASLLKDEVLYYDSTNDAVIKSGVLPDGRAYKVLVNGHAIASQSLTGAVNDAAVNVMGGIVGQVVAGNGRPIKGATVRVEDSDAATVTDQSGRFTLASVRAGMKSVTVTADGFLSNEAMVTVTPGMDSQVRVVLPPGSGFVAFDVYSNSGLEAFNNNASFGVEGGWGVLRVNGERLAWGAVGKVLTLDADKDRFLEIEVDDIYNGKWYLMLDKGDGRIIRLVPESGETGTFRFDLTKPMRDQNGKEATLAGREKLTVLLGIAGTAKDMEAAIGHLYVSEY